MPEVKAAEHAVMFAKNGHIVWDDYINRKQFALTDESLRIVRWFGTWRAIESVGDPGTPAHAIALRLLEEGVLIAHGSPEHQQQDQLTQQWGRWGRGAEYQHFSARTTGETPFYSVLEDELVSASRAATDPPPSPWRTHDDAPALPVDSTWPDSTNWQRPNITDALHARRSVRQYSAAPITLSDAGTLARVAAGPVDVVQHPDFGEVVLKTSPSAGARSPIELYVYFQNVSGAEPGLYHYAPRRGAFERLSAEVSAEQLRAAVGDQPWLHECAALFVYSAVIERTAWRYASARAYRDVLIEVGHISQTILVTAAALGLGAVTATAVRDEVLERLIGADPAAEPVLAVTAIGMPAEGS